MTTTSIQKNKGKRRKDQNRPGLTIDTDLGRNKKKAWHQFLLGKDKVKSECNIPDLPTPPHTASPDGPISSQNTQLRTQSSEEVNGVQSAFRKLHVRSLSKIRPSADATSYFDHVVVPNAPEPIIPSLAEWTPEDSLLPSSPWEFLQKSNLTLSNHNYQGLSKEEKRMGRIYTNVDIAKVNRKATIRSVDHSFAPSIHSSNSAPDISRRKSCPGDYDAISDAATLVNDTSPSHSFSEKDIIVITEEHTRQMPVLKKCTPPVNRNPVFKGCRKVKAQAAEMAAQGTPIHITHSNVLYSTICEDYLRNLFIPTVFDPDTHNPIIDFSAIQPRKLQLRRKSSWKREAKALNIWQQTLKQSMDNTSTSETTVPEKRERYALTRLFILKEFFTTEVTFWNQLYYSKIMFYDPLASAFEQDSPLVKEDMDPFSNLFELMQFSAKLINRLLYFQPEEHNYDFVGTNLLDMTKDLVVFLRCAIDYKANRKVIAGSSKVLDLYKKKLYARKETSQFTLEDYLIIPIQRVARYGLLLADLIKHTEKKHPDYDPLVKAYKVITSLTVAMDSAQQKHK